jgi:O-antigen ligase
MTHEEFLVEGERRTRWLGGVAVFLMVMTPLLGYLAPLGFAPLLALVGLLAIPGLVIQGGARSRPAIGPMAVLAVLVVWTLISLAWTPAAPDLERLKRGKDIDSFTALKMVLQLGLYGAAVASLGGMSQRSARLAGGVMLIGMGLLALIGVLDGLLKAAIYQALRVASGDPIRPDLAVVKVSLAMYPLALLIWPCARILDAKGFRGRNVLIALLALAIAVGGHLTGADAPVAAILLGGLTWLGVRVLGKPFARALIPIVVTPFIFAPMVVLWGVRSGFFSWLHVLVPPSWDHRLNIWAFTANQILHHALRGWGIDAARTFGDAIPLHTHNAAMQLWLELGAVGAALVAAFFAWVLYRVVGWTEANRRDGAMAAAATVSYLVIGGLSFGVWQEWWLALGALTIIACGVAQKSSAAFR